MHAQQARLVLGGRMKTGLRAKVMTFMTRARPAAARFTRRAALVSALVGRAPAAPAPAQPWRGFNLQEKFTHTPEEWRKLAPEWGRRNEPFRESDFAFMAEMGFNFARLPMSYRCWADPARPREIHERTMQDIDQAVAYGRQYGVHVCLNFHRAPGYCINASNLPEPWDLWSDEKALEICTFHWERFAERYRGVPAAELSFNLINEPSRCTPAQYAHVVRQLHQAIRAISPHRTIIVDGLFGEASLPVTELAGLSGTIQSARGYAPFSVSHYLASWAGTPRARPVWPMPAGGGVLWDRAQLHRWCIQPFAGLKLPPQQVIVGEWGCWNRTPHSVTLAWMTDYLALWRQQQWGWALWCLRGSFGVLDSGRADVKYERWRGHRLDRRMLELLRENGAR